MSFKDPSNGHEKADGPSRTPLGFNKHGLATVELASPLSLVISKNGEVHSESNNGETNGKRSSLFGKVSGYIHSPLSGSRVNSVGSTDSLDFHKCGDEELNPKQQTLGTRTPRSYSNEPVKETNRVCLEYDPLSRRKVLNTYEILREIGRGEHGKVKLAKDLLRNELVAIKIVNRRPKRERKIRRASRVLQEAYSDHNLKIRREIAIMKKCNHKHIVKLREVLDDKSSHKIYLVLEYLEKGEIKWKRKKTAPIRTSIDETEIPCCGPHRSSSIYSNEDEDNDLLSNEYLPNLTFKQSRKIFRDVLLGLEYLHLQGIVHRDIKPANLLVSSENIVKISDFGVSFASSLNDNDDGYLISEADLAKTVGSPAFFAPELCQTNFSSAEHSNSVSASSLEILRNDSLKITKILPKIDYKIDIWALGVTLYCLLFGKVPFNAESEYGLFQVIVNQQLEFPETRSSFNSPVEVNEEEFNLAKDLITKLLDKNSSTRIEIKDIKQHPFVLMDLDTDIKLLHDLLYLNEPCGPDDILLALEEPSKEKIENAVVGIGSRIKKSIYRALKGSNKEWDRLKQIQLEASSEDSSTGNSIQNSSTGLNISGTNHSVILSEEALTSTPPHPLVSHLYSQEQQSNNSVQNGSFSPYSRTPNYSRDGRLMSIILQDAVDCPSSGSSRRGSAVGIPEASQIETKRNVVGDVYLKNQSIVDTFKDIQQKDDQRRKSSIFSNTLHTASNLHTPKNSVSSQYSHDSPLNALNNKKTTNNQLKVGPISINNSRRPSSVISLPLSESFASLDSLNDDYLNMKYQEFTSSKKTFRKDLMVGDFGHTQSDPAISFQPSKHVDRITEQFQKFNLDSLMRTPAYTAGDLEDQGIAPKSIPHKYQGSSSSSCSSSSYSSHSGSDGSEDSDEEGNLTLAFNSKVTPSSRPKFLSLSNRAKSHESNLPRLVNAAPSYPVPIFHQGTSPQFEDIPEGLMSSVPRPSLSTASNMNPSVSVITSTASTVTITPDYKNSINTSPYTPGSRTPRYPSPMKGDSFEKSEPSKNNTSVSAQLITPVYPKSPRDTLYNNHYNNHYKKDPINYPFPNAIHLDADKESFAKADTNKQGGVRPNYYRSNSITVGLLQHQLHEEIQHESYK